jgi:hypothetical protein
VCASFISQLSVFWIPLSINDAALYVYYTFSEVIIGAAGVASFATQVLCLNNGKNVIRILDHVSVLDSEHSGAPISYYRLYTVFIFHLISSIISFVAPNIMWFAAMDTYSIYILNLVHYTTVYLICYVVLLLSDTQFIHFVLLLKYRFSVLNDTLVNFTLPSLYKTSVNHTIRAPAVDRSVNSSTSAVSSCNTVLKSTLRTVCRHHNSLCDISEFVNRTYSLQILLSVTVTCIGVLYTTYSFSAVLSRSLTLFSSQQFFFVFTLVGVFVVTAKVVLLVVVCNRASHEVSGLQLW